MAAKIAGFRSDEARERFLDLYDRAIEELWPVPSEELDVETSFGTTRVRRSGKGPGAPLVLVHGHAGTSVGWAPLVERLTEKRQILVIDVIGALGRSVQTRPIECTEDLAAWFRELLDGLGVERAHVVGFSEGGFVAFHATLGNTDRLASMVAIDSGGTIERVKLRFLGSMVWAGLKAAVGVPDALKDFAQRMTPGVEFPDLWWEMVIVGARNFRHALPMPKKVPDEDLRRLTTPTLLYMAGHSEVYDAHKAAERARDLMPDVEIVIVKGAGHGLPFTHEDRTWPEILDFIDRHEPAEAT